MKKIRVLLGVGVALLVLACVWGEPEIERQSAVEPDVAAGLETSAIAVGVDDRLEQPVRRHGVISADAQRPAVEVELVDGRQARQRERAGAGLARTLEVEQVAREAAGPIEKKLVDAVAATASQAWLASTTRQRSGSARASVRYPWRTRS